MSFEVNQTVQVLDGTGVWRNGTILSKTSNKEYKIHLKSFSSRLDSEYAADIIRLPLPERSFQRASLKCKSAQLSDLVLNDKIIYTLDNEEKESKVFENDLFNGTVKVFDNGQTKSIQYEHIIITSKHPNYEKYSTKLKNPPKNNDNSTKKKNVAKKKGSTKETNSKQKQSRVYIDTAVDESNQDLTESEQELETIPSKRIRLETSQSCSSLSSVNTNIPNHNPTVLLTALTNLSSTITPRITLTNIAPVVHATSPILTRESGSLSPEIIDASPRITTINQLPFKIHSSTQTSIIPIVRQVPQRTSCTTQTAPIVVPVQPPRPVFNAKEYIDNIASKINSKIDTISKPNPELADLSKAINESTSKITSTIEKLATVLTDFLEKQVQNQMFQSANSQTIEADMIEPQQNFEEINPIYEEESNKNENENFISSHQPLQQQQQNYSVIATSQQLDPVVVANNLEYLTHEQVTEIQEKSNSATTFANTLMERLFKLEEYVGCNVNGRGMNRFDSKKSLDRKRMKFIEILTNKFYNPDSDIYLWPRCVKQMNRRILEICPHNKSNKNIAIKVDRSIC